MKYFIDTEFLEGTQRKRLFGIPTLGLRWDTNNCLEIFNPYTQPTIDLISIGIVAEDGREYYAISKDFNIKEAWNRYDEKIEPSYGDMRNRFPNGRKYREYWIRENVLKPIYKELHNKENLTVRQALHRCNIYIPETEFKFTYSEFKKLLNKYGKTNKQIAEEIKEFVQTGDRLNNYYENETIKVEFYAYYADYDWVAFCWLFGKMMNLPNGFPMYCIDLKQMLDEKADFELPNQPKNERVGILKNSSKYPKQTNEHNALSDAKWNFELFKFLGSIK